MRISFFIFVFSVSSCLLINCSSDDSNDRMNEYDNTTAKREITNVIDGVWDALSAQDLERFTHYILSDWRLYTERGNKMDAKTLIEIHKKNMTNFNLEYSHLEINVHDSVAWVTYDATMSGLWQGQDWGGDFLFTNVFIRNDGEWKIAHMHESKSE